MALCGDLLRGNNALLLLSDSLPTSDKMAQQALAKKGVRTDFALLFARDELRLCKLGARGEFGHNSVALVVAELARRVGARTELQRACLAGLGAPRVLDAFAGWGMDAFALVGEGASVHCIEQQPALCALLRDAQRRVPAQYAARLSVQCGDALALLQSAERGAYDVIYLDPMFVTRKKGALPNKRLQFLAQLCESPPFGPTDLMQLVELARAKVAKHVVLKRRKRDPELIGGVPDRQVVGASVRYDIYTGLG